MFLHVSKVSGFCRLHGLHCVFVLGRGHVAETNVKTASPIAKQFPVHKFQLRLQDLPASKT